MTKKRLNKQPEKAHSPKNLLTLTYLLTIIVLSSPWLFSTAQDIYYTKANRETIASIKEVAKEKGFSVKIVQFGNKVDLFETKRVRFVIFLEVGTPNGSSFAEIEDYMEKIKFERDTGV